MKRALGLRRRRLHRQPSGQAAEAGRVLGPRRRPQVSRDSARPRPTISSSAICAIRLSPRGHRSALRRGLPARRRHGRRRLHLHRRERCRRHAQLGADQPQRAGGLPAPQHQAHLLFLVGLHLSRAQPARSRQRQTAPRTPPIRPRPTASTAGRSCSASGSISPSTATTASTCASRATTTSSARRAPGTTAGRRRRPRSAARSPWRRTAARSRSGATASRRARSSTSTNASRARCG